MCRTRDFWLSIAVSTAMVYAGLLAGMAASRPVDSLPAKWGPQFEVDGRWYLEIAQQGYGRTSVSPAIAFFPGYPCALRSLAAVTSFPDHATAILISQTCAMACAGLLYFHFGKSSNDVSASHLPWIFCLWPTTFFFRMAYSESLFLVIVLTAMWGMHRNWHPLVVSIVAGAATAVRPVGVALSLPLAYWLWAGAASRPRGILRVLCCTPFAFWGIAAFMAYQNRHYDSPTLFAELQSSFVPREVPPWLEHMGALITLEPFWSVYLPNSTAYWARNDSFNVAPLNLQFANPLWVLLTWGLVAWGVRKKWLTTPEILLSAGLLLIPYVTHAYRGAMWGQGRYAAVVYPAFFVAARLLADAPRWVSIIVYSLFAVLMFAYTVQFAAGYRIL